MASQGDWRNGLTAADRYNNIVKIETANKHNTLAASAFALEDDVFTSSSSREVYDAACNSLSTPDGSFGGNAHGSAVESETEDTPALAMMDDADADAALTIGPYAQCQYVASGVTADVYRSGGRALKVIREAREMQPHDHVREAKILAQLKKPCIVPLLEAFRDQDQQFVLVFPFMPLSLDAVLSQSAKNGGSGLSRKQLLCYFGDVFTGLVHIHGLGVIHRDIKPSAVLLQSRDGPACISDFGTAWHPQLSEPVEPADRKVLDIGTGPYRAPEALFGDQSYGASVDMWAAGAMLAESARSPPRPLFESRPAHEDGSQLGLILSIFKTVGTPTRETWPEAASFKTPPFDMYRVFEPRPWSDTLPDVDADIRALAARMLKYGGSRATAEEALHDVQQLAKATSIE